MIIRIWILLSLQGKEKICRTTPCSCLACLVPLGGMMLLAVVFGTTDWWWGCSSQLCGQAGCGGTPDPSEAFGIFCPSIRNSRFSGDHRGCAVPMQEGVFPLPSVLRLVKCLGCHKTKRDVWWSELGIELGCAGKLPGLVGGGPRMWDIPTVTPQQWIQYPQVSPWTV